MTPFEKLATAVTLAATFGLVGCPTTEGPYPSASGRYPVGPNPYSTRTPTTGNVVSDVCRGAVNGAERGTKQQLYYQQRELQYGTTGSNVAANALSSALGGLVGGAVRDMVNAVTNTGHEVCDPNAPPPGYYGDKPVQQIR